MTEPEKASIMLKYDLTEEEIQQAIEEYDSDWEYAAHVKIEKVILQQLVEDLALNNNKSLEEAQLSLNLDEYVIPPNIQEEMNYKPKLGKKDRRFPIPPKRIR